MVERGVRILVRFGCGVFVWVLVRCGSGVCFFLFGVGVGVGVGVVDGVLVAVRSDFCVGA